ncbi:transposase [Lactobacillus crispatus]
MNDFTKNMTQALFNQDKINDLLRKELQQAVNDLLEAELTAFLGYDPYDRAGWNTGNSRNGAYFRKVDTQFGEIEIQVPRDRNGMFHQHTLPDYKQHSDILESMIIKLYSKGVTTREIADLIEKMYGSHYSPAQVSNISKQMIPKVEAYQIESFNNVIKRKAKPKAEFPTEQSLDVFIGIQAMSYNDRYFDRIHKGFGQVQDTLESYFD